ncbi:MAG: hypothetical protein B6D64_10170 [Bacteroidetes bacterium 4484_276]|nr:MAG: hypothetical protein B6D64_10170 [Bacteroidetes bacterium 4484_276]
MGPIIIVGMHRSGTSLVAEILQKLGVFIGADLDDNYESDFFYNLNRWIFYQSGSTWDNPQNLSHSTGDFISQIEKNLDKQVSSIKTIKYLGSFIDHLKYKSLTELNFKWGWKDPRNTFTFDFWRHIFPEARIINIYRNPIDVAMSLKKREELFDINCGTKTRTGFIKKYNEYCLIKKRLYKHSLRARVLEEGVKLWEEYVNKILSAQWGNHKILHLHYEDLITGPSKEISKLIKFAGLNINEGQIQDATGLVNKRPCYSFISDKQMIKLYRTVQHLPSVKNLGYQNII